MRHYIPGGTEDLNQRWDYAYDANTVDSTFPTANLWGRLVTVQFGARDGSEPGYLYEYSYNQAGRVANQRMQVSNVPNLIMGGRTMFGSGVGK